MNNKKLNCHPELVEGSQQNCIASRDIAENAKLNHEIAKELRRYKINRQLSSTGMTKIVCLTIFTLLPTFAQAEQCTPTPDCKSLGYTETSCPDGGGVKCPWNTSLMYCCKKCEDKPQTGLIGDFYYCEGQIVGIRVPGQSFVIAMNDAFDTMIWNDANRYSAGYRFCRTGTIGRLPTKDELLKIHDNITYLQEQLQKNGGQQFSPSWYWSSSPDYVRSWVVDPVIGDTGNWDRHNKEYVRLVLDF